MEKIIESEIKNDVNVDKCAIFALNVFEKMTKDDTVVNDSGFKLIVNKQESSYSANLSSENKNFKNQISNNKTKGGE